MGNKLHGTVYVSLAVVKDMKKRHDGSIINLSSNTGMGAASSGATFYAVSKTALISLTKRMAHEARNKWNKSECYRTWLDQDGHDDAGSDATANQEIRRGY